MCVWWLKITREKDKAAEQTEIPTCAAPAFPERVEKTSKFKRVLIYSELLYLCSIVLLEKLIEGESSKQGLGSGSSFHGERKAAVHESASRMNGWRCWAVGNPLKKKKKKKEKR